MNDYNAYFLYMLIICWCVVPFAILGFGGCYYLTERGLSSNGSVDRRNLRIFQVKFSVALILFVVIFFLVLTHPVYENIKSLWLVDGVASNDMVFLLAFALCGMSALASFLVLTNCPGDD